MTEIISYNSATDMVSISMPALIVTFMGVVSIVAIIYPRDRQRPESSTVDAATVDRQPLHFTDSHVIEHNPEEGKPFVVYELDDIAAGGFECSSEDEAKRLVRRLEERMAAK